MKFSGLRIVQAGRKHNERLPITNCKTAAKAGDKSGDSALISQKSFWPADFFAQAGPSAEAVYFNQAATGRAIGWPTSY